jgi:hypothetical protein
MGMINVLNLLIAIPLTVFPKTIVLILWGQNWIGVADFLPYIGAIIPMQTLSIAAMDLYVIEKKERFLVTLEIPLTLILVLGIVVGAFFSAVHIIRFYAIAFIIVLMPLELYLAHYKIFHFTISQIIRFWVPKLALTAGMIFSIWLGHPVITGILMAAFEFETVYFKFNDIKDIYQAIQSKLKKRLKSQEQS